MSHASQKTTYFVAGLMSGLLFSSVLYSLNTDFQKNLVSSVFQVDTENGNPDKEIPITIQVPPNNGADNRSDRATEVLSGGIIGRSMEHILVKFKENIGQDRRNQILSERSSGEKGNIPEIDVKMIRIPNGKTPEEFVSEMKQKHNEEIEFAELDGIISVDEMLNDPAIGSQWHHPNIMTPTAWDGSKGENIIIAILDSGMNTNHEDFNGNLVAGWNVLTNTDAVMDLVHGHGIKVAGSAGAIGGNSIGIAGVAPIVKIMPVRVSDDTGYMYFSNGATGLIWAADRGARVANLSFNGVQGSSSIASAATYFRNKGGVVTVSAGNTGGDTGYAPSSSLTVASAIGSDNLRTSWSSFGNFVDITAPGGGIYTTGINGYTSVNGTSFSAPITAGVYALIFSANPSLSPAQADQILFSTADDLGEPGWDMYYGWGRVNAARAVELAKNTTGNFVIDTVPPTVPTSLSVKSVTSNSASLTWNASSDTGGLKGYSLMRNGVKIASGITGTSYTDGGLSANTNYTYTVSATDNAGNTSGESSPVVATTSDLAFTVSTSVPGKTLARTSATVTWTSTKAGTATIKYGTSSTNMNQVLLGGTTASTSGTFGLTGLTSRTTYSYQVSITDSTGKTVTSPLATFTTKK